MKILILKPSSLGDVIQALPVLRLLKKHLPQSQIYWWIETRLAPLLEGDPDLAGLVLFDRQHWGSPLKWTELVASIAWLRSQHFDWVIDLQCLARSGAFAWLANGDFTVGLDEPREGARGFYDRIAPRASFHTHAVDWYKSVLPLLGIPANGTFEWLPSHRGVADDVRKKGVVGDNWIVMQPGARWLNKRWPIQSYVALARTILSKYPEHRIAVLGSGDDNVLAESICANTPPARCLNFAGKLSLREMVECIRLARLMITNDTGPMHVAAALGKPVVAMFGPTEPRRTGPYGQLDSVLQLRLPCVPCMRPRCTWPRELECLTALTPTSVMRAVDARLRP